MHKRTAIFAAAVTCATLLSSCQVIRDAALESIAEAVLFPNSDTQVNVNSYGEETYNNTVTDKKRLKKMKKAQRVKYILDNY